MFIMNRRRRFFRPTTPSIKAVLPRPRVVRHFLTMLLFGSLIAFLLTLVFNQKLLISQLRKLTTAEPESPPAPSEPIPTRILIAANFYNNERVLKAVGPELIQLCQELGISRVFVSIYENGIFTTKNQKK